MYDLAIIGGGISGLTAAIYATRYMLKTIVISKDIGGVITKSPRVENWPGFKSISGLDLMDKVEKQAVALGAEIINESTKELKKENDIFKIKTAEKDIEAKAVILAFGTEKRKLKVPGEREFEGKGVSYCAICDGAFFKNMDVAVVGGGNSAFKAAQMLLEHVKKLYIVNAGKELIAEEAIVEEIKKDKRVTIMNGTGVKEIKGDKFVNEVVLNDGNSLNVSGVFVDIGFTPKTELSKQLGVETDKTGYIIVDGAMKTNVKGVYAAGDITTGSNNIRQLVTKAGEGCIAATSAYNELKKVGR